MDMDLDEVSSTFPSHSLLLITSMNSVNSQFSIHFAGGMYNDDFDIQKPCERLFSSQEQSGSSKQARSIP